jgi:hypothetical protein
MEEKKCLTWRLLSRSRSLLIAYTPHSRGEALEQSRSCHVLFSFLVKKSWGEQGASETLIFYSFEVKGDKRGSKQVLTNQNS